MLICVKYKLLRFNKLLIILRQLVFYETCNFKHILLAYSESPRHLSHFSHFIDTPIRLRGGWTLYDGLVEVFINSSWKSVCYEGFTQQDAQTVCRISGQKWKNVR